MQSVQPHHMDLAPATPAHLLTEGGSDQLYDFLRQALFGSDTLSVLEPGECPHVRIQIDEKGVDAFADGGFCAAESISNSHYGEQFSRVACLIVAIVSSSILDLMAQSDTRETIGRLVPGEILGLVQHQFPCDSLVLPNQSFQWASNLTSAAGMFKNQIEVFFEGMDFMNPVVWAYLMYIVKPAGRASFDFSDVQTLGISARKVVEKTGEICSKMPSVLMLIAEDCIPLFGYIYHNLKFRETGFHKDT